MPTSVWSGHIRRTWGTWGRMCRKTPMTQNTTRCKAIYCSDGWFELREEANPEAWIATDTPHDIVV